MRCKPNAKNAKSRTARTVKGWARRAPKLRSERAKVYARCGPDAFLVPNKRDPKLSKYPIVRKSGGCEVDCVGLRVAKARAAQQGRKDLVRKADAIAKCGRCRWAE